MTMRQDFYDITASLPLGSGTAAYIEAKFEAVTAHLINATRTDMNPDQLYITFASAAFIDDNPAVTPEVCFVDSKMVAQLICCPELRDWEWNRSPGHGSETASLAAGAQRAEVRNHQYVSLGLKLVALTNSSSQCLTFTTLFQA